MNDLDVHQPKTVNLEWWEDLRPLFLGRMFDIAGIDFIDKLSQIGDNVELEYQISKDMEDDSYVYNLLLPGTTINNNGSKNDEGWLEWEFEGKYLLNEDGIMHASSFVISWWRTGLLIFISLFALNLLRRKLKNMRHNINNNV